MIRVHYIDDSRRMRHGEDSFNTVITTVACGDVTFIKHVNEVESAK